MSMCLDFNKGKYRINRNIVECKYNMGSDCFTGMDGGINRNIVECKYGSTFSKRQQNYELIETLWNVNVLPPRGYFQVGEN